MLKSFANILKVPELRKKLFFTLIMLAVFRFGVFLPLPGIDASVLEDFRRSFEGGGALGKLFGLANMFSGGALGNIGIFSLGVMPYISASIIFSLLTSVVPSLEKLSKETGGHRKINQYTRLTAVIICLIQSFMITWNLNAADFGGQNLINPSMAGPYFVFFGVLGLTAGSMFLIWLGDQITEFGIGQGVSIIIMIGIISRFPDALVQMFTGMTSGAGAGSILGVAHFLLMLGVFFAIVLGIVLITLAHRRIPLQVARSVRGTKIYGGVRQYIPIKVNHANVMPIIFASALMMIPSVLLTAISENSEFGKSLATWFNYGSFVYTIMYMTLIVFFCFFWNAISLNPKDMAENLKNSGQFIPGIRPGEKTQTYLNGVIMRVTTAGAFFIVLIAFIPMIVTKIFVIDDFIATGLFGGSGLLIVVGVALDMVQKIEAQLSQRHYKGFMGEG